MGGCSSSTQVIYSEQFEEQSKGSTPIYRHRFSITRGKLEDSPDVGVLTIQDVLNNSAKAYANKPLLSSRSKTTGQYESKTYDQCYKISQRLGSGIINLGLFAEVEGYSREINQLKVIGVFSKNREEWLLLEYANLHYGFTMVPFYDTLGMDTIPYIIDHTGLTTIFCSAATAATLAKVTGKTTLRNIVLFDEITADLRSSLVNFNILSFQDVIEKGEEKLHPQETCAPEGVLTFSYTSGTTGVPKAVMQTHKNYTSALAAIKHSDLNYSTDDVHLSYLPLPHTMERLVSISCLYFGAHIYFYSGDVLQLKKDITDVRPTVFISVPRLYNRFYGVIKDGFEKLSGVKKSLAEKAVRTKIENLNKNATYSHSLYDKLVFSKVKPAFGGRVRAMVTGSAPISSDVISFLKIAACCPIYEGYGQTETAGASFVTYKADPTSGHVGGPTVNTEFKLIDIPEMGYHSTDIDENGRKKPRGEVLIRGPGVMAGYYKDKKKTDETIDEEGWVHTGDVAELLPNGAIRIIDRRKNIFKLSQGEYIAPEKIENIYIRAKGVAEAFVYGDSLKSALVAIIVPNKEYIEESAKQKGISGSFEELCQRDEFKQEIFNNLEEFGKAEKLNGFERVKRIHLDTVSFVVSGCCTSTFKMRRHEAKKYYQAQIDSMYKNID